MSESERSSDLAALLSRAKKVDPGPERLARVLARLEGELGPLESASPGGAPGAPTPASAAPRSVGWLGPGLAALGVLVLLFLGWRAWPPSTPTAEGRPNPHPRAEASTDREERAEAASDVTGIADETAALPAGSVAPIEVDPAEVAPVEVAPIERARSERPPSERPPEEAIVPLDDPGSTLREEIAILDGAMAAHIRGDLEGAREALARHRARFPDGRLAPERERLEHELAGSVGRAPASPLAPAPALDEPPPSP